MTPRELLAHAAGLREFATQRELQILEAVELTSSIRGASTSLGVSPANLRRSMRALAARAARRGWSPDHDMTKTVPEPFVVRGTSTLYGAEGETKLQWVKTRLDDQKVELMMRASADAMAAVLPRLTPVTIPSATIERLLNCYILSDIHLGMMAWHREGGADWDLKIAESTVTSAFREMLTRAPAAGTAVIANLGDLMHFDGIIPVTPSSGHVLDADSRFPKVVSAAIRLLRRIVDEALARHAKVIVLLASGNHDQSSSVWLQTMFSALYENEPSVDVVDSPLPYYAIKHGRTALFFHHGHLKKFDQLPLLFAAQFPVIWGETTKRYAHTGHMHHQAEKEFSGIKLTQHPTLAAKDAYSARGGYISERQAACVTYDSEWGECGRTIVVPDETSN